MTNQTSFFRAATLVPRLRLGDVEHNAQQIIRLAKRAAAEQADLAVFPELSLVGYTLGDLLQQETLLTTAREGLAAVAKQTAQLEVLLAIGLPLTAGGKLYNCAAVIYRGRILGLVPKSFLPNYGEFYEQRWFTPGEDLTLSEITVGDQKVPLGVDLLFDFPAWPDLKLGVEICEDLWAPIPPSSRQTLAGATIIANLSASNELVGKADYRRQLVAQQSARGHCGYVYTSTGVDESTTDVVFGGHCLVYENGALLAENQRYQRAEQLVVADIDLEHLQTDRIRGNTFAGQINRQFRMVEAGLKPRRGRQLQRRVEAHPFVPGDPVTLAERTEEIFQIQTTGLATRLQNSGIKQMVIGLSGGLDSTLALLVMRRAAAELKLPPENIHAFTMPGFATSKRTRANAGKLAEALGVKLKEIDIKPGAKQQLSDIGHDQATQDVTYENVQARYRTMILMNQANQLGGVVVGTGDLSEIALGWSTFNGDHISHYNVNAGVPKTLVRHLVAWVAEQPDFADAKEVLGDILATPISPELVAAKAGEISQSTEEIVGPYELHDFFLYHFARWGSSPAKILLLAETAFGQRYTNDEIKKWLRLFIERFFRNQWKRSVMPDGPKVGTVALSPRGDWRMPSDAQVKLWLNELQ